MSFRITVTVNSDREEDFEKMLRNVEEIAKDIRTTTPNAGTTIKSEFTPVYVRPNSPAMPPGYFPRRFTHRYQSSLNQMALSRQTFDLNDITLQSRAEAEEVLDSLTQIIDNYGYVTIADLKAALGYPSNYGDTNAGWNNIRDAHIERVQINQNGWVYKLTFPTRPEAVITFNAAAEKVEEEVKAVDLPPIPGHEFVLATRDDAQEVIRVMKAHIEQNGWVTLARLFELCGIQHEQQHNLWGWKSLGEAGVIRTRDGFVLDFPKPVQL